MRKARFLVLDGYGINCDDEMLNALLFEGADAKKMLLNDLAKNPKVLREYHGLIIPGGFAHADYISAGQIYAKKLKRAADEELRRFIEDGKIIGASCNGAQILVKYPLLPNPGAKEQTVTLTHNAQGRFEDRWVHLRVNKDSPCVWTKGLEVMYLPIRHGEGRFVARRAGGINQNDGRGRDGASGGSGDNSDDVLLELWKNGQIVMQYATPDGFRADEYPFNPNFSTESIAAICNKSGTVFGGMPHPDAALYFENHPHWTRIKEERRRRDANIPEEGAGRLIFRNGVRYVEENLI